MAKNIETKAKITSPEKLIQLIEDNKGSFVKEVKQHDIYFETKLDKRLKLRSINDKDFVLIGYDRPNSESAKTSDWRAVKFQEKDDILELLTFMYEIKVEVKKIRKVYKIANTEIHIDEVDSLGNFLELETSSLNGDPSAVEEHNRILKNIGILEEDFINYSYSDLLIKANA